MKKIAALLLGLLLLAPLASAEDDETDEYIEDDIEEQPDDPGREVTVFRMNEPGDQFIKIAIMMACPLNFGGTFPLYRSGKLNTGGFGSLGYHRFLTSWLALGLDVSFGYNPTIGGNIFTYVPLVANVMVQPTLGKFEFPLTAGAGVAMETYMSRTYFPGLVVKGSGGVYYRVTPSWSFGIDCDFMYMPQWYSGSDSAYNDHGNFLSFGLSARYHF